MIHQVEGDILMSKAEAIAHGVAPNDDFKQGLALSLRKQWPAMYKDFRHYCKTYHPKEGTTWAWGGPGGTRIVALFTQDHPTHQGGHARGAHTPHINHALKQLRSTIEEEGWRSVALPRLATGVGGLEWADVEPLIHKHLGDLSTDVYVYTTYKAGVAAREPGLA